MADFHRKNFFYHNSVSSPLTIESSERVMHDVTSHILGIFLSEVQGYVSVSIMYADSADAFNPHAALNRVSEIESADEQYT